MNNRDVSFFLLFPCLISIILIGYSIRYNFDNKQYGYMVIAIGFVVFFLLIVSMLVRDSSIGENKKKHISDFDDIMRISDEIKDEEMR